MTFPLKQQIAKIFCENYTPGMVWTGLRILGRVIVCAMIVLDQKKGWMNEKQESNDCFLLSYQSMSLKWWTKTTMVCVAYSRIIEMTKRNVVLVHALNTNQRLKTTIFSLSPQKETKPLLSEKRGFFPFWMSVVCLHLENVVLSNNEHRTYNHNYTD